MNEDGRRRRRILAGVLGLAAVGIGSEAAAEPEREGPRRRLRRRLARRQRAFREAIAERRLANPEAFERSRRGEIITRGRIIAIDPAPAGLFEIQRLGMRRLRDRTAGDLGVRYLVLLAPRGMSAQDARDALERADPGGAYELDHVFDPSDAGPSAANVAKAGAASAPLASGAGLRIGIVDGGVDLRHPSLARARIETRAFVAQSAPSSHGTAVASLLVGDDGDFRGALPGAQVVAADVFGADPDGGSAEAIAEAIGWLVSQRASVISVSLEGPPNRLVEAVCKAAVARGVLLVAAVGNSGPNAPVAYPAAYPSVVAATAVDASDRVFLFANRGPQVAFAALGVDVEAAAEGDAYTSVSGTSFAAPRVAAALAALRAADPKAAIETLARRVRDLGAPGRDVVYGFGRAL